MKDFAFTQETLRSGLMRSVGIEHPLQDSVDEAVNFTEQPIEE